MADAAPAVPGVIPHLVVDGGAAAIDFYVRAFGAAELARQMAEDGRRVLHAALAVNGGRVMLHDPFPEFADGRRIAAPPAVGGTSVYIHLGYPDADAASAAFARAVAAGATAVMPIADMFWGERYGQLRDPFGHIWSMGGPIGG